ncbi:MAG TPA: cytochrome C [Verrucomicrobiae bacterium]|nr:cytochrome C [Verrucomicrobiae bacterium]
MKKMIVAMVAVVAFAGVSVAADVVEYNAAGKMGKVTFNHKKHQETLKDCKACHKDAPGKIAIDKDKAHKELCKDCHAKGKGPTKCGECHKK